MVVSKSDDGRRVMVLADDWGLMFPGVKVDGSWKVGIFSADDLKDNFSRVTGKEAEILFQEAVAAISDNPNLLRDVPQVT